MDTILIILAGVFVFVGLIGSVLPVLPGVALSYAGLLLLHFTDKYQFSNSFLITWAIVVVLIQVLDYVIPIWGTKKFGGSKRGVWGSSLGMVAGVFLGPWGVVLGPFVGALLGELSDRKALRDAMKAAFGAFLGFVIITIAKLIVAGFIIYYYIDMLL
jgi:uncharacterized protein YqgC (DUF456 family)